MTNRISEVNIVPIQPDNGLVGFASFVWDKSFYFGSIGIMTRPDGSYYLLYPTKKTGNKNFDTYHPINRDVATEIGAAVIARYKEITKELYA